MKLLALIRYTVLELSLKAVLWVLAGISALMLIGVLLGLSSRVTEEGTALVLFGQQMSPAMPADQLNELARQMQAGFARGLMVGVMLFGVFATASVIPDAMDKGLIDLYLSKPIRRWELLLGKSLGAITVIGLNIVFFLGGLWLVFGVKVGAWNMQLLLSAFTLTFLFACLYSIVAFLGVVARGSAIPIIGAFLYLVVIVGILEAREQGLYQLSSSPIYRGIIDGVYYAFPQLSGVQDGASKQILHQMMDWKPFVQSILSATVIFAAASWLLSRKDF